MITRTTRTHRMPAPMRPALFPSSAWGLLLAAPMLLAGCAGNVPVRVAPAASDASASSASTLGGPAIGGYRAPAERGAGFYAMLQPAGAGWQIVRFGSTLPDRTDATQEILFVSQDGQWVQPAFSDERKQVYFGCSPLAKDPAPVTPRGGGAALPAYEPCGSSRFSTVNVGATAARTLLAVPLTLGMGVGTNRTIDVAAVRQALDATQLLAAVARARESDQQLRYAQAQRQQAVAELGRKARAALAFDQRVTDDSGFYVREIVFPERWVDVRNLDAAATALSAANSALPSTAASPADWYGPRDALTKQVQEATAAAADGFALGLKCGPLKSGPYSMRLSCPETVRGSELSAGRKVPLDVLVQSYEPGDLSPAYANADNTLRIHAEGAEVQLENLTGAYLEVRELSCYAEGEIFTRRWAANDSLTLPPQSQLKPPLQRAEVCRDAVAAKLRLGALRAADVQGQSLRFGFAVKYRKAGETADRTLFLQRSYRLDALIRAGLPGAR